MSITITLSAELRKSLLAVLDVAKDVNGDFLQHNVYNNSNGLVQNEIDDPEEEDELDLASFVDAVDETHHTSPESNRRS